MQAEIPHPEKTILVAESEPFLRAIIVDILRNSGISKIHTAGSCPEAITQIRTWLPDAIIMDWRLRNGGGAKLTRWVRKGTNSPNPEIPVIILTGDTSQETILSARDSGIDEIIIKPVVPKAVVSRVNIVLRAKREFVQSHTFVGPDRRRRNSGNYKGDKRRLNDATGNALNGASSFSEIADKLILKITEVSNGLDIHDGEAVMVLYQSAQELWDESQKLENVPMETIAQSLVTYVQAVGVSGKLEVEVVGKHMDAIRALQSDGAGGINEHSPMVKELKDMVTNQLLDKKIA